MSKETALIDFPDSAQSATVSFSLEQKEYPDVDPSGFAAWYVEHGLNYEGAAIFSAWMQYLSACEEDGSLCVTLRVRLSSVDLDYVLRSSWGEIGPPIYTTETRTEYLKFELSDSQSVDFGTIVAADWVDRAVYDASGAPLSPPAVTFSGSKANAAAEVLGVLECTVVEQLFEHELVIMPRTPTAEQVDTDDSILDELYASTCWLFCAGGIDEKDVEMPDNFGTCDGGYGGGELTADDDDESGEQVELFIDKIINYCSGDLVEEPSVYIDGELVTGESVMLDPGNHTFRVTAEGYTPSDEDDLEGNDSFTI